MLLCYEFPVSAYFIFSMLANTYTDADAISIHPAKYKNSLFQSLPAVPCFVVFLILIVL